MKIYRQSYNIRLLDIGIFFTKPSINVLDKIIIHYRRYHLGSNQGGFKNFQTG